VSNEVEVKTHVVPLRWRDLDFQGHVYHGTYVTLLDEAREAFFRDLSVRSPHVVARIEIDYLAEIAEGVTDVGVRFDVLRVGNSSLELNEEMYADGVLRARSRAVVVMWGRDQHGSRPLTDAERAIFEAIRQSRDGDA